MAFLAGFSHVQFAVTILVTVLRSTSLRTLAYFVDVLILQILFHGLAHGIEAVFHLGHVGAYSFSLALLISLTHYRRMRKFSNGVAAVQR